MTSDLATVDAAQLHARMEYAKAIAVASLLPEHFRGKPANVLLVLEYGRSLGIEPITALNAISVVKGRPTMSAELMRALVARDGHRIRIVESTAMTCTMEVARHEWPDDVSTFTYTIEDAQLAGLDTSDTYRRHPKAMLLARCTTAACRAVFADVIAGISYTPDELEDVPQLAETARPRSYTTVETVIDGTIDVGLRVPPIPVDDDGVIVDAELVDEPDPDPVAAADVGHLTGPAARARATEPATARQLHELGAFASSLGSTLDEWLAGDDVRAILGGRPSSPLSKAHATTLISAARSFDREATR